MCTVSEEHYGTRVWPLASVTDTHIDSYWLALPLHFEGTAGVRQWPTLWDDGTQSLPLLVSRRVPYCRSSRRFLTKSCEHSLDNRTRAFLAFCTYYKVQST